MSNLLVDVRTPYQASIIRRIFESGFFAEYESVLIVAPKAISGQLDKLGYKKLTYDFDPAKHLNFAAYFRFGAKAKRLLGARDVDICTGVNHGPFFNALKCCFYGDVYLFEDGISTFLRLKKRFSFFDQYKFLHSKNFEHAILEKGSEQFVPADLSSRISYVDNERHNVDPTELRDFFVSSSSVEYGLESIESYFDRIKKLASFFGNNPLCVSFHHNEARWREKLTFMEDHFENFSIIDRNEPLEEALRKVKIGSIVAPYNTSAMNVIRYFGCENLILFDDNGPNMKERIEMFKNIRSSVSISHFSAES